MTKYARIKETHLIDVWRVPEDYPDLATRDRCLGADGWIEVPDDAVHGAHDNGDGTFTNPPAPPAVVSENPGRNDFVSSSRTRAIEALKAGDTATALRELMQAGEL